MPGPFTALIVPSRSMPCSRACGDVPPATSPESSLPSGIDSPACAEAVCSCWIMKASGPEGQGNC
jgi:hypothetical protein